MSTDETESALRLTIDGREYRLEPDDLELGEVELLEETLDAPIADIDFSRAKATRVLVYLMIHRDRPEFTLEDAGKLKLSSLAEQPESNGNGNGAGAKAKTKRPTPAAKSGS